MSGRSDDTARADAPSRGRDRLRALLHTNLFSLGDMIGWIRGREPWWPTVIERADLPAMVGERIRTIVRRTRLWNSERCEVARELCNHALEALEAGRSPDEIAGSLGETKPVARLIRRSMKRKRPLTWKIRAWTLRGMGIAACALFLIGGFMAARFYIGSPSVTRNFLAELNAPLEQYADDEKAWPLLKQAWASVGPKQARAQEAMNERASACYTASGNPDDSDPLLVKAGIELLPLVPASHPDYEAVLAVYRDIQPELDLMREAARRPVIGRLFSTRQEELPEELYNDPEARGWLGDPIPDSDDPAEQDMLIGVLLPTLGPQRWFARWFAFEARLRIAAGDAPGAVDSIETILLLGDQVEQDQFLIGYLVAMALEDLAIRAVSDMLVGHRDTFADEDLVRLAHLLGQPRLGRIPLEGEEMWLQDFLQRTFTDDGNGDGHFTNEGLEMLGQLEWLGASIGDGVVESTAATVQVALIGSRADQQRMADRAFALLREEEAAGYDLYRSVTPRSDMFVETLDEYRYRPLRIMLPALSNVVIKKLERRARVEACLVAIGAELFRRDTGGWPGSVGELVPRYLPFVPEDPVTGDPLTIVPGERVVTVYSVGSDGNDDGGVMDPEQERDMRPRTAVTSYDETADRIVVMPYAKVQHVPDGDWVLFPHPE